MTTPIDLPALRAGSTPGPWAPSHDGRSIYAVDAVTGDKRGGQHVGMAPWIGQGYCHGDVELMAAAPALLARLERAERLLAEARPILAEVSNSPTDEALYVEIRAHLEDR